MHPCLGGGLGFRAFEHAFRYVWICQEVGLGDSSLWFDMDMAKEKCVQVEESSSLHRRILDRSRLSITHLCGPFLLQNISTLTSYSRSRLRPTLDPLPHRRGDPSVQHPGGRGRLDGRHGAVPDFGVSTQLQPIPRRAPSGHFQGKPSARAGPRPGRQNPGDPGHGRDRQDAGPESEPCVGDESGVSQPPEA